MNDAKPANGDGLLADLELVWNSISDDKHTNAAYQRLRAALATPEQPGSSVQGEANADRWVAVKPAGAPYWGIHTETGETIAGTSSGLSEGAAKRIVALHNNELCEADDLLRELGLDPIRFRSEGGWLNAGKIRAALLHPQDYADLYTTPPPAPAAEQGKREADRRRFPDPDFNAWLDQGISDCGHTVWDAVGDVQAAWQGWEAAILAQPEARGVEGMVREFLTRAKVPGKDYLYCIKPKELDALFAATPNPVRAEQPEGKWKLPDAKPDLDPVTLHERGESASEWQQGFNEGWNEYRAAMLAAAPAAPGVRVENLANAAGSWGDFFKAYHRAAESGLSVDWERAAEKAMQWQRRVSAALEPFAKAAALAPDGGAE